MNALCLAMKRPEESIQTAIEKTSPVIFEFLGPFLVDVNIEKAEVGFKHVFLHKNLRNYTTLQSQISI